MEKEKIENRFIAICNAMKPIEAIINNLDEKSLIELNNKLDIFEQRFRSLVKNILPSRIVPKESSSVYSFPGLIG